MVEHAAHGEPVDAQGAGGGGQEGGGGNQAHHLAVAHLDAQGRDLIPRKDRVWTLDALASRMIQALQAAGRPVPNYFP